MADNSTNWLSRLAKCFGAMHSAELEKREKQPGNAGILSSLRTKLNHRLFGGFIRVWYLLILLLVLIIVLPIALYFTLAHHTHALGPGPIIDLGYARYHGVADSLNVNSWRGMRYARPPIGDYRFAPPADPLKETDIQNATAFGPVCVSSGASPKNPRQSEDCLFINVFAPTNADSSAKLPVYVFIQGGGFNGNANANYNGAKIIQAADMKAVVVNFNYRVAAYGFLASEEMANNDTYAYNAGLLDQRKALEWVQQHISTFGGDPKHVTLGGASAGAGSVVLQMTAYNGRDDKLFQGVMAESQAFPALRTVKESEVMFETLAANAGCNQTAASSRLDCLRHMPFVEFQTAHSITRGPYPEAKANPIWYWGPTLDQEFITNYTYNQFANGQFVKVPAIFGDATNEGTIFTPKSLNSQANADTFIQNNWPNLTTKNFDSLHSVFTEGPRFSGAGDWWSYGADMFGMVRYICPGTFIMDAFAKANRTDMWNYRWNVQSPANQKSGYGATHVGELGSVWNGGAGPSSNVQKQFVSFIRSFNPNTFAKGTPTWDPWGKVGGNNRILYANSVTGMEKVDQNTINKCNVLHSIGASIMQ